MIRTFALLTALPITDLVETAQGYAFAGLLDAETVAAAALLALAPVAPLSGRPALGAARSARPGDLLVEVTGPQGQDAAAPIWKIGTGGHLLPNGAPVAWRAYALAQALDCTTAPATPKLAA